MSITINNGVSNIKATPGIIADDFANIPAATDVATGTIFIDTVGLIIYRSEAGGWFALGGGGSLNLQQVLNNGNIANDKEIILNSPAIDRQIIIGDPGSSSFIALDTSTNENVAISTLNAFFSIPAISTYLEVRATYLNFQLSSNTQLLYPNAAYNNQKCYLPESDGTIQLQDPRYIGLINSTPSTPTVNFNCIHRVVTGASSIVLNPANWKDRITGVFLFDITATFTTTGGATIKGQAFINNTGLIYVMYLQTNNTFYISHI